eukprot:Opistho-2@57947
MATPGTDAPPPAWSRSASLTSVLSSLLPSNVRKQQSLDGVAGVISEERADAYQNSPDGAIPRLLSVRADARLRRSPHLDALTLQFGGQSGHTAHGNIHALAVAQCSACTHPHSLVFAAAGRGVTCARPVLVGLSQEACAWESAMLALDMYIGAEAEIDSIAAATDETGRVHIAVAFRKPLPPTGHDSPLHHYIGVFRSVVVPAGDGCAGVDKWFASAGPATHTIIDVAYAPLQVSMARAVASTGELRMRLVATGADGKVHEYWEDYSRGDTTLSYVEAPSASWGKGFGGLSSCSLNVDTITSANVEYAAVGCQSGQLRLSVAEGTDASQYSAWYDAPICSIHFFTTGDSMRPVSSRAPFAERLRTTADEVHRAGTESPLVHLAVASALGPAVVYWNVGREGLSMPTYLPHSDTHDVTLCVRSADCELAGRADLLVGSWGGALTCYRLDHVTPLQWNAAWQREFAHPVMAVAPCTACDGTPGLAVLTRESLHVMQLPAEAVASRVGELLSYMSVCSG